MAKKLLQNCGGPENIVSVANCLTRLRLEVKDAGLLNDENIKKTGAKGVIRLNITLCRLSLEQRLRM